MLYAVRALKALANGAMPDSFKPPPPPPSGTPPLPPGQQKKASVSPETWARRFRIFLIYFRNYSSFLFCHFYIESASESDPESGASGAERGFLHSVRLAGSRLIGFPLQ